ncbi:uncharacterized protein LOC143153644 [Ptiloglossa arizonensis]|uniref:uncharacterized protein LOC143153644 n=1 Tax=Ptiloglossa arizonensis TaxID=3350558 RepID=UPI003F9F373C
MAHPSNPRLMNRVLEAVEHLCGAKGSTARDILDFLRETSRSTSRNLTMQVQRALKHAVNAGLLRQRSGRYKLLFTLNPASARQAAIESNNERTLKGMMMLDTEKPTVRRTSSDSREGNRGKGKRKSQHRDRKRKRGRSRQKRRRRRSGSSKEDVSLEHIGKVRNLKYKEKGERDRSPRRRISDSRLKADIGNASSSPSNRKRGKVKSRDQEYYSDLSDNSDYDDRKTRGRRKTPARQEVKYNENGKSCRRSASRNRSPQRQQSQQLQPKHSRDDVKSNKTDSDDRGNVDRNDVPDQDTEKDREPNNSGSNSNPNDTRCSNCTNTTTNTNEYILQTQTTIRFNIYLIPRHASRAWELIHIGINENVFGSIPSLPTKETLLEFKADEMLHRNGLSFTVANTPNPEITTN